MLGHIVASGPEIAVRTRPDGYYALRIKEGGMFDAD